MSFDDIVNKEAVKYFIERYTKQPANKEDIDSVHRTAEAAIQAIIEKATINHIKRQDELNCYLRVLLQNARITLWDGYWLQGDISALNISYGTPFFDKNGCPVTEGLYTLDAKGVDLALKEIDKLRESMLPEEE